VPYCFGTAKVPRDLRSLTPPASDPEAVKRLRGAGVFRVLATAEVTGLRALVLEYILEAVTVAAAPGLMAFRVTSYLALVYALEKGLGVYQRHCLAEVAREVKMTVMRPSRRSATVATVARHFPMLRSFELISH
jgi:hypothetical protein